jgi:hypothetical protein
VSHLTKREVYLFDQPGEQNTPLVAEAVARRLEAGDLDLAIVATSSGRTALEVARAVKNKGRVLAVTGAPYRREWGMRWPALEEQNRRELEQLGVTILERAAYVFHDSILEGSNWQDAFPERLMKATLYTLGQGLKVAVEVALMAVSSGLIEPYQDVIAVGGTSRGADTAVALRATYPALVFSEDKAKRLEIREVLAMPLAK